MLRHIHESNLIEDIDSLEAMGQSCIAWAYLEKQKELSHSVICKVQKIITLHQKDLRPDQRGYYRILSQTNVTIGGKRATSWTLVKHMMDNWLLDYAELDPKEAHIRFEHIHPFVDGNGRTGRMLMWWHERQLGKEPTLILAAEREEYYKWFRS